LQTAPLRPIAQTNYANATQQGAVGNDQLSHVPSRKLPEEGLELYLEKIEKEILMNALNLTHWNRTLAAKKARYVFPFFALSLEEIRARWRRRFRLKT
jgi:two-component system, NtrC family, response regulator PilR